MDPRNYDRMPTVGAVMTPFPYFVHPNDPVEQVERIMREHNVRHVPVEQDGRVVGLITDRDLGRLVNPALPRVDKLHIRTRAILLPDPYVVEMGASLADVVGEMAERKIGSAIVVKGGKLVGVLTAVDVCRELSSLLRGLFSSGGGEAA
jgi:CBS domain-containing protein